MHPELTRALADARIAELRRDRPAGNSHRYRTAATQVLPRAIARRSIARL
jgi:hypothetical protein